MKFDTIDFKGLDDIDNFYPILDKNQIKTHIRVPGKIGLYPPSYLTIDPSELESLENNNISITPSDVVDDIAYQASEKINLPKIAQDRISKLQEYASSIDISKVKIDKDGISILLPSGELRL